MRLTGSTGPGSGMTDPDLAPWNSEEEPDGATPLTADEIDGLKPSWIATRADLNTAEQENIAKGLRSRRWTRMTTDELLDDLVIRQLHRAMFGDVWTWAGQYRLTEKNLGCDPVDIAVKVRDLCADARYWFTGTPTGADDAGCRFHRDLVAIHPFPNGNGRHSRAATDLLMRSVGEPPFTWGSANLMAASTVRSRYIAALHDADAGNCAPLRNFARS
jgi:Fic-DOC domain mobile mystery protein B